MHRGTAKRNHTGTLMAEIQSAVHECHMGKNVADCQTELYTSSEIANMIKKDGEFEIIKLNTSGFKVLGTPDQLKPFLASLSKTEKKKRFCFDLDNTLVTSPQTQGDYRSCKPVRRVIGYVQQLHADGHYIIIHTAR